MDLQKYEKMVHDVKRFNCNISKPSTVFTIDGLDHSTGGLLVDKNLAHAFFSSRVYNRKEVNAICGHINAKIAIF